MDKVEMSGHEDIEMEAQDTSNDDSNQQRVLIDFGEVIDGGTMAQEILESEEVDSENISMHTGTETEVMEMIDDSQQDMSEVVAVVTDKIESDMHDDSLPRIEITEVGEDSFNEDDTKKTEPDTEAVSEDELPNEAAAKVRNSIYYILIIHFRRNHFLFK